MTIRLNHIIPDNIKLDFDQQNIWKQSILFEKDKYYVIVARSGKGKSSLLNFILGFRFDYKGEINIGDKKISNLNINEWSEIRKTKLSFVSQSLDLLPNLTLIENINLNNELTNFASDNEIDDMLKSIDLLDNKFQIVNSLSMGQKQRVAIVRALCQPFDFLILDEPFSHLDKKTKSNAFNLILQSCQQQKASFIMSSLEKEYIDESTKIFEL